MISPGALKLAPLRHPAALHLSLLRHLALEVSALMLDPSGAFAAEICARNSFDDFIASADPRLAAHTCDPQTRMLGFDNAFDPAHTGDPSMLARAKDTLALFDFGDITERYADSLRVFENRYL